jgi:ATP/maltotriose-dependent transcriptional regulator MalT/DNA-binding SARP family transcriptional activator
LGLGEEDLDPQVFLNYFLEALCQAFPGSAEKTRNRYGNSGELSDGAMLATCFINELVEYARPVAIGLDDYHLVDQQPLINTFMKLLLRRGPANLTLLMTSRDQPDIPLAWLRSKRLLTEIHQEHLRFTLAETQELFRDVWNQPLDDDLIQVLVEKTEGWATGLQLVAQAIRARPAPEVRRYILDLQGADSSIFDYLASEVFEAQPAAVREFLTLTSLPDNFNALLAQELVPSADALEMIAQLKSSRLFLVELDRDGKWYRYHHLFGDFLRSKLRQEHGRSTTEAIHGRVAQWLFHNEEVVASLPHFLASGDLELAAQMLERVGSELLHKGLRTSISRWLEMLPASLRQSRPGLVVLQAELCDLQGQWQQAVEGYKAALEHLRRSQQVSQQASVLEKLSLCYLKYGESRQLLETCEEGLQVCPEDNRALRSLLQSWLGGCLINSGADWTRGYQLLRSSHSLAYEAADPRAISWACMFYGFVYHFPQGNYSEALRTLNEGIDFFTRLGWPMVLYQLAMNKALVLIIQGDPTRAASVIDETLLEARRAGHTYVEKGLGVLRGHAYLEGGNLAECRQALEKISQTEIPAQFKPFFFRHRMLLNSFEQNNGQARVDGEEMERSLLLNGAGMYAPECFASLGFMLAQTGELSEAQHRIALNLRLCEQAQAKFWMMKSHQVMAWIYFLKKVPTKLRSSLEASLRLTQANDYSIYWVNDAWKISIPLLVAALAYRVEVETAEKLLARLSSRWGEAMEELLQHSDPAIRKVAVQYLGGASKENLRSLLKGLYRNDPDQEVREAAKKSLKMSDNGARLQIYCLGPLRLSLEGDTLDYVRTMRPLGQRLLKFFLANSDRVVASDKILDAFWPDLDPEKGRHNLATQLSSIRRDLGTQMLFPRQGDGYRLCNPGEVEVDVVEFERCCRQGLSQLHAGEAGEATKLLYRAEQLYQGEFLQGDEYEDWIDWRRRELREMFEEAMESLGDYLAAQDMHQEALPRYRKLLEGDEPQERVFQKVFRCYEKLGDRQGAHREYEAFRSRLKESLGLEPLPATRALIEALFLGH